MDEGIYAVAAQNLLNGGEWLGPHFGWHGSAKPPGPFLEKPPLAIWLEAIALWTLGSESLTAIRLPATLATVATGAVTALIGIREADWRHGFAAGLLTLTLPPLLLYGHGGRYGSTDALLTLFGTVFVYAVWQLSLGESGRWPAIAGCAAGLAVMTKGVAAGQFLIVLFPVALVRWRALLRRDVVLGSIIAVVVALPWHLIAFLRYGDEFVRQYWLDQVVARSQGQLGSPAYGEPLFGFMNYPYLQQAFSYPFPPGAFGLAYLGLLTFVAVVCVYRIRTKRDWKFWAWCWWWAVAIPITFSLAGGDHAWYLIPMVVPLALLLAIGPAEIFDQLPASVPIRGRDATFVLSGLIAVVVIVALANPYAAGVRGASQDQADLAPVLESELPEEATIVYPEHIVGQHRLFETDFYAGPGENLRQVATEEQWEYAWVLTTDTPPSTCRTVWKGRQTDLRLVRCGDASASVIGV
jgi:4-amino-4-deoxy-L-arabinose transferase-like glycosyltransferase